MVPLIPSILAYPKTWLSQKTVAIYAGNLWRRDNTARVTLLSRSRGAPVLTIEFSATSQLGGAVLVTRSASKDRGSVTVTVSFKRSPLVRRRSSFDAKGTVAATFEECYVARLNAQAKTCRYSRLPLFQAICRLLSICSTKEAWFFRRYKLFCKEVITKRGEYQ